MIERESTSVPKSAKKPKRETSVFWSKELDSATQRGREYIWIKLFFHRQCSPHNRHVLRAARALTDVDENQANAVAARIELDLRIGAAFTRLQSLQLQRMCADLSNKLISYGTYLLQYIYYK